MAAEVEPMAPAISASLLAGVLESAMDAIITVNERQEIVLFNQAAEKMFGWLRHEVMQQPLDKLIPQRFRSKHVGFLGQFGATRSTARSMGSAAVKIHGLHADGQEFPIEVSISQVETPVGLLFTAIVRDITERQAEQAHLALLQTSITHLNDMLLITEAEPLGEPGPRIVFVNAAFERHTGYSLAEVLGRTPRLLQGPLTQRTELDRMSAALRAWQPMRAELINYTKSGQAFWVEIDITPVANAEGVFTHWVSVQRDITQRKQAEQALANAEARVHEHLFTLQRAADAAQAIAAHLTLEGMAQELAEQACGVIGAHQAAVSLAVDGDWTHAIHALSLSPDHARYRSELPLVHGSAIYRRGASRTRPVCLSQDEVQAHPDWRQVGSPASRARMMHGWLAVPLTSRDGRHIGVLQLSAKYQGDFTPEDGHVATEMAQLACIAAQNACLIQEISQLNAGLEKKVSKRTAALARQEALFRALAEQAPQIIWTTDQKGEATYLNQAWLDLMGGKLEDWTGMQWLAVLHPEDRPGLQQNWALARTSELPFSGVRRWLCKDGSVHSMAYRASPVRDEQGQVAFWVGIDADVTEFKLIEGALRRSNEELEAFSYSVSHDLRTPLSTINGFSGLLARQLAADGNAKTKHYLTRIQHGVAQMGNLIDDLLSLASVTRARLRYSEVDLSAMAHRILDEWHARQPARRVTVQVEPGLLAHADEVLLTAVMENLLGNAWKFSALQPEARISVAQQLDAAGLPVFFVQDNGAGFDMAHAEKLFLPFERLHGAAEFAGSGIGLATVSRIIGRHGGRLWADAKPGLGATFYFTLPRQAITA